MLFRRIFAMRAPVAVVYDGGGVYLGGASSNTNDTGLLSEVISIAGIVVESVVLFIGRCACGERAVRGIG